ncbi:MAG: carboxypeptidase M32 [Candidatus Woesearchaeota archaeon]|nr:MAG: carboxypeptidase M32 [Candidatus Woesearchaeota archaeon]
MSLTNDLNHLKEIDKEISLLNSAISLLWWDRSTIMPTKAAEERAEQISYLTILIHEKSTSKELNKIILRLSKNKSKLNHIDRAIINNYSWKISRINKLPKKHVKETSRTIVMAQHHWEIARKNNNFKIFEPYLKKIIELKKREAEYIDSKNHPYEVLLQDYERGMSLKILDETFNKLKPEIHTLIKRIKKSSKYGKEFNIKKIEFDVEKQKIACQDVSTLILEDNERFLITVSMHPFMTKISPNDLRITTSFRKDPLFSLFSTVHESGHALYESEFDQKLKYSILHDAPSLGIHESQSRLWENQVCKSKNFWKYYYPKYQKLFPKLKNISLERFYESINIVRPSLIRIESDELTYHLHIIIRYELEKKLIEGKIAVSELPVLWNKLYKEYLGITPKTDTEGVLQDVHWSQGSIAYFPTYTLGTIYSAMIYEQMLNENPKLEQEIEEGDFKFIKKWLKENIHKHGAVLSTSEIMEKCCGKKISEESLIKYYKNKFGNIYKI